jgi:YD repeat-containing protein
MKKFSIEDLGLNLKVANFEYEDRKEYDDLGRVVLHLSAGERIEYVYYGKTDQMKTRKVVDDLGYTRVTHYNRDGQLIKMEDSKGNKTKYYYYDNGKLSKKKIWLHDLEVDCLVYSRDEDGKLFSIIGKKEHIVYSYDDDGELKKIENKINGFVENYNPYENDDPLVYWNSNGDKTWIIEEGILEYVDGKYYLNDVEQVR